jgi:hypothetical protein
MILWFDEAFRSLSVKVSMVEIEQLAMLVHHSMDSKTRAFHTTRHVFAIGEGMKPLQVLAAIFHDVVYYQLDDGFPARLVSVLDGVTREENGVLILQPVHPDDRAITLCADIFGFAPGQALALHRGMNEFLSAVAAARLLQRYLTDLQLIAVVACIEATIPFRELDAHGRTAAQALAQRVQAHIKKCQHELKLSEHEGAIFVKTVVTDAVTLANRDVAGFTEADPGSCLSNTWLLIEESNAPLAAVGVYSLQEYRGALLRMDVFLRNLNPELVCQSYDGFPDAATLEKMSAVASRNIAFSSDFLGAKLTSIAVIEALALSTGTDCPIAMFLGDISSAYGRPDRVEDFLPEPLSEQPTNPQLLAVLEKGRTLESVNDLTASRLTAFVYRSIGEAGTRQALEQAKRMFDGSLTPRGFLTSLNRDMVRAILRACVKIARSRSEALTDLESSL